MKIEVSKNMLAGALVALGKLVNRMSPVEEYKSVLIVLENGFVRFHTCGPEVMMEFTLNCESEGYFRQTVHFDALQKAVPSGKGKGVSFELESGILLVNGVPLSPIQIEWPEVKVPSPLNPVDLPDGFVEMLSKAAPIVNRNNWNFIFQKVHEISVAYLLRTVYEVCPCAKNRIGWSANFFLSRKLVKKSTIFHRR